jgi:hypothetical protein
MSILQEKKAGDRSRVGDRLGSNSVIEVCDGRGSYCPITGPGGLLRARLTRAIKRHRGCAANIVWFPARPTAVRSSQQQLGHELPPMHTLTATVALLFVAAFSPDLLAAERDEKARWKRPRALASMVSAIKSVSLIKERRRTGACSRRG